MPRTLTWNDGQQSASAPSFGSLNRFVDTTRAAPQTVSAGTAISHNDKPVEMIFIESDGGQVNMTANPQIDVGAVVSRELNLLGVSDTNTIILESGNGLVLNGAWLATSQSILNLLWDGTSWIEMSRSEAEPD